MQRSVVPNLLLFIVVDLIVISYKAISNTLEFWFVYFSEIQLSTPIEWRGLSKHDLTIYYTQ